VAGIGPHLKAPPAICIIDIIFVMPAAAGWGVEGAQALSRLTSKPVIQWIACPDIGSTRWARMRLNDLNSMPQEFWKPAQYIESLKQLQNFISACSPSCRLSVLLLILVHKECSSHVHHQNNRNGVNRSTSGLMSVTLLQSWEAAAKVRLTLKFIYKCLFGTSHLDISTDPNTWGPVHD